MSDMFTVAINKIRNSYKIQRTVKFLKWKLFLVKNFLPLCLKLGEWSLNIDDFELIFKRIRTIKHSRPLTFVELGSGTSTIVFAKFLSRFRPGSLVISFEGDRGWADKVKELIKKFGLSRSVDLQHVPYKEYPDHVWFDRAGVEAGLSGRKTDILFVDAPPGPLCPHSRKPAIPFFLPWLQREALVFIHDTKRKEESECVQSWSSFFRESEHINTLKGITMHKGVR